MEGCGRVAECTNAAMLLPSPSSSTTSTATRIILSLLCLCFGVVGATGSSRGTAAGAGSGIVSSGGSTWEEIAETGSSLTDAEAEGREKGELQLLQKVASGGL